jgi:hypothetical protein
LGRQHEKEDGVTTGENLRRAILFKKPDWIPVEFHINGACWNHYPHDALQELMVEHPPALSRLPAGRKGRATPLSRAAQGSALNPVNGYYQFNNEHQFVSLSQISHNLPERSP